MGYYVTLTSCNIHIPESHFPRICKHIIDTGFLTDTDSMNGGSYTSEGRTASWYSWVDMESLEKNLKSGDLDAVIEDFGFEVSLDDDGAIVDLSFDNKTGNEEDLFRAMAPALTGTHTLYWSGEEGENWKWVIKDGKFKIFGGLVIYPED